jgi:Holliday junction resolvasome RuvABC endonuclease subunit
MKILALDPAEHTGYAHSDGPMGVWLLSDHGSRHPGARLERLRERIYEAFRQWGFERLAFEDASFGSPNPNVQAMHNELRGVVKLVAAELGVEVVLFKPTTIKKFATGSGRADKGQMIRAAKTILGIAVTDDNVADALFILEAARQPDRILEQLPKAVKKRVKVAAKRAPRLF